MAEKNCNGFKLRFSTPQIIAIIILIVTLAVTLASKADRGDVNDNHKEIELLKQTDNNHTIMLEKIDGRQIEILTKLSTIEGLLEERGKGK